MVHFSGFYAWVKEPLSQRAQEDLRQTDLIRQAWTHSGKVYGYRKLDDGLLDQGQVCSEKRVARLASLPRIAITVGRSLEAQTQAQGHDPFGPMVTVHQHRVTIVPRKTQSCCQPSRQHALHAPDR